MRKHSGERPYRCPVAECDYSCARSWHVTRHMERHHPEEAATGPRAVSFAKAAISFSPSLYSVVEMTLTAV